MREQVGDNPVYRISPETGGRPVRTLHRNLLLQVNDLPVEPPQNQVTNRPKPQKKTKKYSEPLKPTEQRQSSETSDSEEEGVSHYWLRVPVERVESNLPRSSVTSPIRSRPGPSGTPIRQRNNVELEREVENVMDERDVNNEEPDINSESEQDRNQSQQDMGQAQYNTEQEEPQVTHKEEGAPEPQPEPQVVLRQSVRERRPGYVFTYPSLGQPAYQLRPTVNAVDIQPIHYGHMFYHYPYAHALQPPSIIPPYLYSLIHCF